MLAESIEPRHGLPPRLEAQLLEQGKEDLPGDTELVAIVGLLLWIEFVQARARRIAGTGREIGENAGIGRRSLVSPGLPVVAEAPLSRRGDGPRRAVEFPPDPGGLDQGVGRDYEGVRVRIPAVVVVFQFVGRLDPHEAPQRRPQGSRDAL